MGKMMGIPVLWIAGAFAFYFLFMKGGGPTAMSGGVLATWDNNTLGSGNANTTGATPQIRASPPKSGGLVYTGSLPGYA